MPKKHTQKRIEVKLFPDPEFKIPYPRFYSNFMFVNHTAHDFTIRFCETLPVFNPETLKDKPVMRIPIHAEAVISPENFKNLLNAMVDNFNTYQSSPLGNGTKVELKFHEKEK